MGRCMKENWNDCAAEADGGMQNWGYSCTGVLAERFAQFFRTLRVHFEFFQKTIHRQFVIRRMQHPLTQYTEVVWKILRRRIHAASR